MQYRPYLLKDFLKNRQVKLIDKSNGQFTQLLIVSSLCEYGLLPRLTSDAGTYILHLHELHVAHVCAFTNAT